MSRAITAAISAFVMLAVDLAARAGPWEWAWLSVSYATGFITCLALLEEEPKR